MDCKRKREMRKVERKRTKNNAVMLTGRCAVCNRKINLLMGRKGMEEEEEEEREKKEKREREEEQENVI